MALQLRFVLRLIVWINISFDQFASGSYPERFYKIDSRIDGLQRITETDISPSYNSGVVPGTVSALNASDPPGIVSVEAKGKKVKQRLNSYETTKKAGKEKKIGIHIDVHDDQLEDVVGSSRSNVPTGNVFMDLTTILGTQILFRQKINLKLDGDNEVQIMGMVNVKAPSIETHNNIIPGGIKRV